MSPKYPSISDNDAFKPKDFYKELAEFGLLDEFVKDRMPDRFESNEQFKKEIVQALVNYSSKQVPTVDLIYLQKLKEYLDKFIERSKECHTQMP